jgi:hypothetical protein
MGTLKEVGGALPHPRVDECLGGFDVIVEVVSEGLDVRNNLISSLFRQVTGEQDYIISVS